MRTFPLSATIAATALLAATSASAQGATFSNQASIQDGVDAIADAAQNDFDSTKDARDFGVSSEGIGWYGSLAASGNATSGNSDTGNLGLGASFGHFDGVNGHEFDMTYTYQEEDGIADSNAWSGSYRYSRYFNPDFFAYGQVFGKYDEFGSFKEDNFAGVGLGYRFVNTDNVSWSLLGGPGYRFAKLSDDSDFEEAAFSVGSKLYWGINDSTFINMDTGVLYSDSDTAVFNDLGLNVSLGDGPLALRTSLRTEYHTEPIDGDDSTDQTFGVSLVYTFE